MWTDGYEKLNRLISCLFFFLVVIASFKLQIILEQRAIVGIHVTSLSADVAQGEYHENTQKADLKRERAFVQLLLQTDSKRNQSCLFTGKLKKREARRGGFHV